MDLHHWKQGVMQDFHDPMVRLSLWGSVLLSIVFGLWARFLLRDKHDD